MSLVVQQLRLCTCTLGAPVQPPLLSQKFLNAMKCCKRKKKKEIDLQSSELWP